MRKNVIGVMLLFVLISCITESFAETLDVRLRICQKKSEEETITRENLIKIKQFILKQSERETYCNMYNNNPACQTKAFRFYLIPDSGQDNINCDPEKSDFHTLTIRKSDGGKNQYRSVDFIDKNYVYVTADWPTAELNVQQIRKFVEDAMKEILSEISKKEPNKQNVGDGR